ncbi:MAG: hypothetical protein MUD12_17130 [Spirochaetes bacterium]|jgi:hypothetical protein|nr:hypothetical protein [Spirochaetota bacterium]
MDNMNAETGNVNFNLSREEIDGIIRLYASRICSMYDCYRETLHEIEEMEHRHEIDKNDEDELLKMAHEKFDPEIGRLLMEQYFNTNDDGFFDRAMKLDEHVHLDSVSYLDAGGLSEIKDGPSAFDFVLFYRGFFLRLDAEREKNGPEIVALVRDPEEVERINKKISRAQMILEIDEATIGRKYYMDLCKRTHYRYCQ